MSCLDVYRADGYALLDGLVEPPDVESCLAYLGELTVAPGRSDPHGAMVAAPLSDSSCVADLASHPGLEAAARLVLGDEPVAFAATFICKPSLRGLPVLWHQDGYPWSTQLGITNAVTAWVALDPIDEENGGLVVIPGSHAVPLTPLLSNTDVPSLFGVEVDASMVRDELARPLALDPGDVCLHHPALIHRSGPNLSDLPRRALAIRYRATRER